jgi:carboxyl-terminal processing protease
MEEHPGGGGRSSVAEAAGPTRRIAAHVRATLDAVVRRLLTPILALLVVVALVGGIYLGGHPSALPGPVRDTLVGDSEAQVYDEALDKISGDYYRKVKRKHLLDASLAGAVDSLGDRFSHYIDPSEYQQFEESTNGEFEGVGLNVQEDPKGLRVVNAFEGGPAAKAGLRKGDLIVAVDGQPLKGRSSNYSTDLIKGPSGTSVRLSVVRGGQGREVKVKRDSVSVPVSQGRMVRRGGKRFAYVSLTQFTAGAHGVVGQKVRDLLKRGADGVVLDLRDNGGGLLQEGVLVASVFIRDGTIVSTRGRSRANRTYTASGDAISGKVPVVVLVNRGTASASEIVTGALQDRGRATVVGTRTFGKGVFQEIEGLSNGGALDITVGQYFTPKGRNLGPHGTRPGGITPDVRAADDPKTLSRDEALDQALDVLAAK